MKKLALIALIMVLGLSGCASSGTSSSVKHDWTNPRTGFWEEIKQEWTEYWNSGPESRDAIKSYWTWYWNNPGLEAEEAIKYEWTEYWNNLGSGSGEAIKDYWTWYWN